MDTTNPRVEEMEYFTNLFETGVTDWRMNHTAPMPGREENPNKAAYLYWIDGQTVDKSVGPAIGLKVNAGDKLDIETYARYENKTSYNRDISLVALASLLGNNFAYTGLFEGSTVTQTISAFNGALGVAGFMGDGLEGDIPFAYLNYILFDEDMVMVDAGWKRVSEAAGFEPGEEALPNMHERVAFDLPVVAENNGYIYIWVSNESENTKVWFDDLAIKHSTSLVQQATDYGAWGDVLREQKADETAYRYGYQGQFAEKDEETGWNHFELREYDPVIGRWLVIDPKRQHWSPYLAMSNNPVSGIDPDGGYSKFGARWRSFFHPGSEYAHVALGKDGWGVVFSSRREDSYGSYTQFEVFTKGNIVFGFEGLGIEAGIDLHWKYGGLYTNDLAGSVGGEADLFSMTVLRFNPKLVIDFGGEGFKGSTWGFEYAGQNGKIQLHQGLRMEGGFDVKAGAQYSYDLNTGEVKLVNKFTGSGTLLTEIRQVHYGAHGGKLMTGFQEEVGKSIHTGGGLSHGLSAGFNIQMTIKN